MKLKTKNKSIIALVSLFSFGVASAISFTNLNETESIQPVSAVTSNELVDTYDIVTLSDFTRETSYTGKQDLTGYYDNGYLKSSTNTDGSVVVRFKQTATYTNSGSFLNIGVRGSDYWSKGIKFYHQDAQYKQWQIQCVESKDEIASNWGGASKFQDGVTYNIELGAINYKDYATSKKIYCYVKVDGEIFVDGTFTNTNDYDYSNPFVGIYQRIPECTIADADTRRLEAKNAKSVWVDSGFVYFGVDEMPAYDGLVGHVNQYGHYAPLANAVLKYHHADTDNDQNLSALGLFSKNVMAINLAYNGLSTSFVENDTISFEGSFAQPSGDRKLVFNADEVNVRYINKWYFEDKYEEANGFLTYMHMDENVNGQCVGYYPVAKAAYNNLSSDSKEIFCNGTDFKDAYERLQKWAEYHGEIVGATGITSGANRVFSQTNKDENLIIVTVITLSVSVVCVALFFALKSHKKKYR